MSYSSSDRSPVSALTLQWNEFSDLLSGASWEQACARWSFDHLPEEKRLALPSLANRFTESRQFLFSENIHASSPLEMLWLQCRLFAGLCTQLRVFYEQHHRPHLGLEPSRIQIAMPKGADPLLPARWNFSIQPLTETDAAVPFVHEGMPSALQANLFQPPHSIDTSFKAPEIRDYPLGRKEDYTVLVRSMEKIKKQDHVPDTVTGIIQLHIMTENSEGLSFSPQDVFRIQLVIPNSGPVAPIVWGTRIDSPERGIVIRGQCEPMSLSVWEQLELAKDTAFSHSSVTFFRSFQYSCDWYSLGLLFFQSLLGRDAETLPRLDQCLPNMIRRFRLFSQSKVESDVESGFSPLRLLFDEQGTLFSSNRVANRDDFSGTASQAIPRYLWYPLLELALRLVAQEPVIGSTPEDSERDASDPIIQFQETLRRITQIGDWIRLELFNPHERRREVLRACQTVRKELESATR